jgi:hypothetical protein
MSTKLAMRAGIGTLVLLFALSALALGAKREDPDAAGELYGDLYVIERDGNGEPVLRDVTYTDPETGDPVTVSCPQPLGSDCSLLPLWGDCQGELVPPLYCDFDPELYDACGVHEDFVDLTQEVSFGRGSVARAQDFVIDSAYAEFLKTINEAVAVGFDPAGRIRLGLPTEDPEEPIWKTIDAPLENLGLYREIVTNGCLGTVTEEITGEEGEPIEVTYALDESAIGLLSASLAADLLCAYPDMGSDEWWMTPTTPDAAGVTNEDLQLATAFLGGATDKSNPLSLDEIINLNTYLGLNPYTFVKVKKERILTVSYFDFGAFTYDRSQVFSADLSWPLLSCEPSCFVADVVDVFGETPPGVNLDAVNLPVCRGGYPLPGACDLSDDDEGCGGANYFAQAAEHARKTIWFIHNWEVPEIGY